MRTGACHPVTIGLVLAACLGSWGCAHSFVPFPQSPLSPEIRNQIGTIGVVAKEGAPTIYYPKPASRGEAAGKGAKASVKFLCEDSHNGLYTLACHLFYGPPLAGIGAAVGAVMAPSAAAVEDADAALHGARAALKIAEAIRDQILQTARGQKLHSVVLLERAEPSAPDQEVADKVSESSGTSELSTAEVRAPNLPPTVSPQAERADAILEIYVSSVSLYKGDLTGEINPSLTLAVTVISSLNCSEDNRELYQYVSQYRGGSGTLTEWGADNARLFRDEVNRGIQRMAGEIVAQLFGTPASPQKASEAP